MFYVAPQRFFLRVIALTNLQTIQIPNYSTTLIKQKLGKKNKLCEISVKLKYSLWSLRNLVFYRQQNSTTKSIRKSIENKKQFGTLIYYCFGSESYQSRAT